MSDIHDLSFENINKKIIEVIKWEDSFEKDLMLSSLKEMLLNSIDQIKYSKGIYLELKDFRYPNKLDKLFHYMGFHHWLEYTDTNVFDCTRRICVLCGRTEGSPLKREYAYYEVCGYRLDLKILNDFLDKWR